MDVRVKSQKYVLWITVITTICISILFVNAIVRQLLQFEWNLFWKIYLISSCVYLLVVAQTALTILYLSILNCIFMQFRTLNMSLANCSKFSRIDKDPAHVADIEIIDRWSKIYDDLTDAVSLVNKCFGLSVSIALK